MERRKKYPNSAEDYELLEVIGDGIGTIVRRARCIPFGEIVAVKILDLERNGDLSNVFREAKTMLLIDHPNVLNAHCSFVNDHNLWVVMPYMAGGSCLHIMKLAYPTGFEEVVIATLLREVLKGLEYLHQHGHIHRDVKAGNILIDECGRVKLGDFGVSACLYDSGDRQRMRNTFVGTPCWMAPEVMEQVHGYDFKADIWSFGITALELAHGHAPFSSDPPIKVLIKTLTNAPPSLDYERDKKFSRFFKHMIAACLVKDPSKRPSVQKLLKQSFFKQAKSHDYIARKILEGLPSLSVRVHTLKQKEAELLAQDKMLDGEREEKSQNEYKKGISSWNFDINDLKAQASLVPENEDPLPRKDSEGCSNSLFTLDTLHENVPEGTPFVTSYPSRDNVDAENDGSMLNKRDLLQSPCQVATFQSVNKHSQLHNSENCVGGMCPKSIDLDEKSKATVVQQKGRFKVTSENLDLDEVHPFTDPPESHGVQNEQEKELTEYIADLQQRLTSAQEELHSLRVRTAQVTSPAVSSPSR